MTGGGPGGAKRTSVRISIVGEEYSIRSDETPEHTRAVAEYVDAAIRRVINSGATVETHRAAILAMLQITDELFKARQSSAELSASMRALGSDIRRWLPPAKRTVGGASSTSDAHADEPEAVKGADGQPRGGRSGDAHG